MEKSSTVTVLLNLTGVIALILFYFLFNYLGAPYRLIALIPYAILFLPAIIYLFMHIINAVLKGLKPINKMFDIVYGLVYAYYYLLLYVVVQLPWYR